MNSPQSSSSLSQFELAKTIAEAGGIEDAVHSGALKSHVDLTMAEVLVLGLLRQGVSTFLTVLGHGTTELGEVLRIYESAGLLRTCGLRNEIEASHAAMALRWVTGEKAAVVTSIGPGALQALAASIAPASDGVGVWYLFGDETTQDEGPNMQQIPRHEQHQYLKLCSTMGPSYCVHTAEAITTALRRGLNVVNHPHRPGPFYLLLPMNIQPAMLKGFNISELPSGDPPCLGAAGNDDLYSRAIEVIRQSKRVVIKVGGGARSAESEIEDLLELADGVAVTTPIASGILPYENHRNMTVGGSKGSLAGNFAMEQADLLIAIGTRFVCQSDCSRTAYPNVQNVININTDLDTATHYSRTIAFVGDAAATLRKLNELLQAQPSTSSVPSPWYLQCTQKRKEWESFKHQRYQTHHLYDERWGCKVLTQPAVIKAATDWARNNNAVTFFDAGDVQANGFQIVEDDRLGRTFTETGASYMGFATSALLATGLAAQPFYALALTGDGSFTMNPQVLIDGVQHGARGCVLLLDNRRMGAISGLQFAQYGIDHATCDSVEVDYIAWANAIRGINAIHGGPTIETLLQALDRARAYDGLSFVYVPVYFGHDPLGSMGVFGRWNVGRWCEDTQALRHQIGI